MTFPTAANPSTPRRRGGVLALLVVVLATVLSGCGGGSSGTAASADCELASQKQWLREYMRENYFWTGASPDPEPEPFASVPDYFDALLFTGNGTFPADRWSYISDSAAFSQFFEEGRTLGYGLFVNGLEARLPLKVRHVEPQSPAAALGLVRGDVILSINGRRDADLIASNDFTALSPARAGDTVVVEVTSGAGSRTVTLTAMTYTLTPVPVTRVLTLGNGTKVGYLMLKDFIVQAEAPLAAAFAEFRDAGATEVIIDLRYNGGGRVSTSNVLASLAAGNAHDGKLFTRLSYSARQAARNTHFNLAASVPGFSRVVVLTGARTCSASELVVNGLKPHVQVVTVGGLTCGKPFGFNPTPSCGNTFSAVNFEALNALGEGRYVNGIAANCVVDEDFSGVLGDPAETLTAAAFSYLQNGVCPMAAPTSGERERALSAVRRMRAAVPEPGERRGMWAD